MGTEIRTTTWMKIKQCSTITSTRIPCRNCLSPWDGVWEEIIFWVSSSISLIFCFKAAISYGTATKRMNPINCNALHNINIQLRRRWQCCLLQRQLWRMQCWQCWHQCCCCCRQQQPQKNSYCPSCFTQRKGLKWNWQTKIVYEMNCCLINDETTTKQAKELFDL